MKKGSSTTIEVIGAVILVLILVLILIFASKSAVFKVVKNVKEKDTLDVNNPSYSTEEKDEPQSLDSYANKERVNKIAETIGKSNKNSQYIPRKKCGYIISDYCYILSGDELFNEPSQSSQQ